MTLNVCSFVIIWKSEQIKFPSMLAYLDNKPELNWTELLYWTLSFNERCGTSSGRINCDFWPKHAETMKQGMFAIWKIILVWKTCHWITGILSDRHLDSPRHRCVLPSLMWNRLYCTCPENGVTVKSNWGLVKQIFLVNLVKEIGADQW